MSKIEIRDLTKSYDGKTNILEKISLDVEEGEFYVLVGPSGCGKSTLLRIIAGLEKITDGKMCIRDRITLVWSCKKMTLLFSRTIFAVFASATRHMDPQNLSS